MIAHVPDDGLNEQTREGCGQEQERDRIGLGMQVLVNRAHIRPLKIPAELYAKETYAHVQYLNKAEFGFMGHRRWLG
jgi:hypothetical protein